MDELASAFEHIKDELPDSSRASIDIEFRTRNKVLMSIELSSYRETLEWGKIARQVHRINHEVESYLCERNEAERAKNVPLVVWESLRAQASLVNRCLLGLLCTLNDFFVQLGPRKVLCRNTIDGTVQFEEFTIDELKKYPPNLNVTNITRTLVGVRRFL